MNWITYLGFFAGICTTISFIPQVAKTIKTKHTKDISLGMYSLLIGGVISWLLYGILQYDWPIIIANTFGLLAVIIIFIYKMIYK